MADQVHHHMDRHTDDYFEPSLAPTPNYDDDQVAFTERDPKLPMECAMTERVPRLRNAG